MKIIIALIFILILSYPLINKTINLSNPLTNQNQKEYSLTDDINQSIIDGFFDGDTLGKNIDNVYFSK